MTAIEKQLSFYILKDNKYPEPDDKINITASGTIINYQ